MVMFHFSVPVDLTFLYQQQHIHILILLVCVVTYLSTLVHSVVLCILVLKKVNVVSLQLLDDTSVL